MVHDALHQGHSHGRAFHGLEARNMLEAQKRDSENFVPNIDNKWNYIHNRPQLGHKDATVEAKKFVPNIDNKLNYLKNRPQLGQKDAAVETKKFVPNIDHKLHYLQNRPQFQKDAAAAAAEKAAAVETVYTQVEVTMTPTATGPQVEVTETAVAATSATSKYDASAYESAKSLAGLRNTSQASQAPVESTPVAQPNTVPTQRTRTTESSAAHTPVTVPTQRTRSGAAVTSSSATLEGAGVAGGSPIQTTRNPSVVGGTPLSATHSGDEMISKQGNGMSGGAKAGLAFGIIIALALCGGLIFFCWRRRKQQKKTEGAERILDEKRGTKDSFFGGMAAAAGRGPRDSVQSEKSFATTRTAATAPRLSLRPVTQFLPNILESRKSSGNALDAPAMSEKPRSGWDRRPAGAEQNPFDDAAMISEKQARSVSPESDGGAVAAGKSPSHSQNNSWEGSEPPTPKSTKFGTAAAVPITAAGAPNGAQNSRGPNNVHRVQLDFKPSMEDEIELVAGQIVRMVHEYDDGWALCMRLDRSQQGVCPRTCLSKLPVKPRPQGPPPPKGAPGRPTGPPPPNMRGRPASPQMNPGMVPRPLTPQGRERSRTMGRDNSPAPDRNMRQRSMSAGGAGNRPQSPVGGIPARKPVPGMAL